MQAFELGRNQSLGILDHRSYCQTFYFQKVHTSTNQSTALDLQE